MSLSTVFFDAGAGLCLMLWGCAKIYEASETYEQLQRQKNSLLIFQEVLDCCGRFPPQDDCDEENEIGLAPAESKTK